MAHVGCDMYISQNVTKPKHNHFSQHNLDNPCTGITFCLGLVNGAPV